MCEAVLGYSCLVARVWACILAQIDRRLLDFMRRLFYSIPLFCLLAAMPAWFCAAEEIKESHPVGVVELFTSQGCSSCPKADAAFAKIAGDGNLIAISYHIDYWNYLGWEDTLGQKENTDRQYGYAKTLGNNNVFTPQMVLNGVTDAKTTNPDVIRADLRRMNDKGDGVPVAVDADLTKDEMTITVGAGTGKADVVMAYFKKQSTVEIAKGENTGQKITYRNAVTKLETVGMWDGKAMTIKLPAALIPKKAQDGCAILLQAHDKDGNPGRIYGAAMLENYAALGAQ
jgi:hypothetical protein